MAEITYRGNLSASNMSLVHRYQGRTVINPTGDQNYIRGLQLAQDGLVDDASRGIPQVYYMHNVMPSTEGFQSVSYSQIVGALGGGAVFPNMILKVQQGATTLPGYISLISATNAVYILKQVAGVWTWVLGVVTGVIDIAGSTVTVAYINNQTYFHFNASATPLRQINVAAATIDTVPITGSTLGAVIGATSAFGYLIRWNATTVEWSSTTLFTDFTPSLVTGAGFSQIQEAKGDIIVCVPHELGFMLFCRGNTVMANYTGNSKFPWKFAEISHAGGYNSWPVTIPDIYGRLASDNTADLYYSYNSSGLQLIGHNGATTVLPDVSDFLSGNVFEDFDTVTRLFLNTILGYGVSMEVRLSLIADRYLVISYGITNIVNAIQVYTHAIVYDTINKRLGKLRIVHICCFEFFFNSSFGPPRPSQPRNNIAFMQSNGTVKSIDFTAEAGDADSVIVLGKFQETRQRMIQLQRIAVENIKFTAGLTCWVDTSLDGKNQDPSNVGPFAATIETVTPSHRTFTYHKTGINHSLYFIGAFYLSSFELKFNKAGRR